MDYYSDSDSDDRLDTLLLLAARTRLSIDFLERLTRDIPAGAMASLADNAARVPEHMKLHGGPFSRNAIPALSE